MFIQTEATPNPATLKFIPGRTVLDTGTMEFSSREAAARSPLAERLFEVPGISGVFYGYDFVSLDRREYVLEARDPFEARANCLGGLLVGSRLLERNRLVERPKHIPARYDPLGGIHRHLVLGPVGTLWHDDQALGRPACKQIPQLTN